MRKMKAIPLLIAVVCLTGFCLTGCGAVGIFDDDDRQADAVMKKVVEAIKKQDRAALKRMFSEKALGEADDFDSDLTRRKSAHHVIYIQEMMWNISSCYVIAQLTQNTQKMLAFICC